MARRATQVTSSQLFKVSWSKLFFDNVPVLNWVAHTRWAMTLRFTSSSFGNSGWGRFSPHGHGPPGHPGDVFSIVQGFLVEIVLRQCACL